MAISPTTELDALNTLLSSIGESPINSLDGVAGVADAVIARQVLQEIMVQVQEEGWHWNTEENIRLSPDMNTKTITVPYGCIQADSRDRSKNVVVRGQRLYDKTNHTFLFESSVLVDMTILLEFTDIPQAARHYITIRAARVFQERVVGSQTLGGFTEKDEVRARAALVKNESDTAQHNMLTGSYSMNRILGR